MEQNIPLFLSKSELALLYLPHLSPHSAVNKIMSWLSFNKELMRELTRLGYKKTQKQFSREQIRVIYDHLGTP